MIEPPIGEFGAFPTLATFVLLGSWVLAAINYYAGTFLIVAPVPHRGWKRIGRIMVQDGAVYGLLAPFILAVPTFVKILQAWMGLDPEAAWLNYCAWLGFSESGEALSGGFAQQIGIAQLAIVKLILASSIVPIVGKAVSNLMWSFTSPVLGLLSNIMFMLYALYFFGIFVFKVAIYAFPAIGALVYGLPARMGRRLGAALISFTLVFYVGLPFLPSFVQAFHLPGEPGAPEMFLSEAGRMQVEMKIYNQTYAGEANVYFKVAPRLGQPYQYLIHLTDGAETWRIWTGATGQRSYSLPTGNYSVTRIECLDAPLNYYGDMHFNAPSQGVKDVTLTLNTYGFYAKWKGDVSPAFLDFSLWRTLSLTSLNNSEKLVAASVYASANSSRFAVYFTRETALTWVLDGNATFPAIAYSTSKGQMYVIRNLLAGAHLIEMHVNQTKTPPSTVEQGDYDPAREKRLQDFEANYKEASKTTIPFFNFSVHLLVKAMVLPALFLLILFTLGRGVTEALGGKRMPVPEFE